MKIRWTPEAENDRLLIWNYIAADNVQAAARMDLRFSNLVSDLATFPLRGRQGIVQGTRELLAHESYKIIYEITDDDIWILAVVHTARQWPPVDHTRADM